MSRLDTEVRETELPIVLFLKAMLRYWWALMSCAAFTFFGIWATFANKGRDWALWSSLVLGVAFLLFAAYKAWATEHEGWVNESRRYDAKFKGLPRLEVRDIISRSSSELIDSSPGVYFLNDPSSYPKCTNVHTLSMAIFNNPIACTSDSVAKGVSATITFYDAADGKRERSVEGRWEKTIAQGSRMEVGSEMLVDEIPINSRKVLFVAIKDETECGCHGTSVDMFHEEGFVFGMTGDASPWVINAKEIRAVVQVRGISVDQCWLLKFTNEGVGKGFTSTTVEEVEPSYTYAPNHRFPASQKRR